VDKKQVPVKTIIDSLSPAIDRVKESQDRFYFVLSNVQKRDSFLLKKYENEALYYQTNNDKYRRRANRMLDSMNKYVLVIDSVAKKIKRNNSIN
jgi:hypothetical protein